MRVGKLATVIALLSLVGCTHQHAFLITAQSMTAAADQFIVVHDYMEEAAKAGTVEPKTYQAWRNFGLKFQAAFPLALDLFKVAVLADDMVMKEKAADIIIALMPDLLKFAEDTGLVLTELK